MNRTWMQIATLSFVARLTFPAALTAGVNRWTRRGPQGARINAIVDDRSNPAILYAATNNGIYKTEDAGESWRSINDGLSDLNILSVVVRHDQPRTLFATSGRALLRTRDGGEHWTRVAEKSVGSLVFDSLSGQLYALDRSFNSLVMRSGDEGETWQSTSLRKFGYLGAMHGKLYAMSDGIYVSADAGVSWVPSIGVGDGPFAIGTDEETMTVAVTNYGGSAVRSRDEGKTWEVLPFIVRNRRAANGRFGDELAVYAGGVVVATAHEGILRYTEGARAWSLVGQAIETSSPHVARTTAQPEGLFASRSDDLYRAIGGGDWTLLSAGLETTPSTDVAVTESTAYALTSQGLSALQEAAGGWQRVKSIPTAHAVAIDSTKAVLLGTDEGLLKSYDRGETWKQVTPSNESIRNLAIAGSDSRTIYAAFADGLRRSSDGGDTWTSIQNGLPFNYYFASFGFSAPIAVDPTNPDTVYVCGEYFLYKSDTSGKEWRPLPVKYVSSLVIDAFDPSLLYGVGYYGVMRSRNGGGIWETLKGPGETSAAAVDPSRTSTVYVGTWSGHVYRSVNAGQDWRSMDEGLPGHAVVKLAVDPSGKRLYASTPDGVFEYQRDTTFFEGATVMSVSLQTYNGNLVSAENCGGGRVIANATSAERCEVFNLYDLNGGTLRDGDRVHLQARNGSFLAAEQGGALGCDGCDGAMVANREEAGAWETFIVHFTGPAVVGQVALQSATGDYVAAENGGSNGCDGCDSVLHANRPRAGEWETYKLIVH